MPHLLDTSAVLAHFLDEPGSDVVSRILAGGKKKALLCAPSWAELERRLAELVPDEEEAERVWTLYTQELCGFLPLDADSVRAAIDLRRSAEGRLPLIELPSVAARAKAKPVAPKSTVSKAEVMAQLEDAPF
jgi:PIN domain nuclease of toxin-antitoxin system